jgi:cytochrome c oxidase subunit 3
MPIIVEEPIVAVPAGPKPGQEERAGFGSPPRPPVGGGGGDDSRPNSGPSFPVSANKLILWLVLTVVVMLFAGFSSAYIILRATPTWQNVAVPSSLWVNTFVLLASSVTIEWTRRKMKAGDLAGAKFWTRTTAVLGLAFLVGQVFAWQQMVNRGIYVASTLHSAFLYILTGAHALHLLGGIVVLAYVTAGILRNRYTQASHEPVSLCATYWHFMDGLWIYLFLMLTLS